MSQYYNSNLSDIITDNEIYFIKDLNKEIVEDNLIKSILTPKQVAGILFPPLNWERKQTENYTPNLGSYLLKYLTKEQIEAEGWERQDNKYDDKSYKYPEIGEIYKKRDLYISFYEKLKEIEIHNNHEYSDRKTYYDGYCPSINEFRYICSLLKI